MGTTMFNSLNGALAVNGVTQSINNMAKESRTNSNINNLTSTFNGITFLDETIGTGGGNLALSASKFRHMPQTPEENSTISSAI